MNPLSFRVIWAFHCAENALWPHFQSFDFFFLENKKALELKIMIFENSSQRVSWGKLWKMSQNSHCREILNATRQELLGVFPFSLASCWRFSCRFLMVLLLIEYFFKIFRKKWCLAKYHEVLLCPPLQWSFSTDNFRQVLIGRKIAHVHLAFYDAQLYISVGDYMCVWPQKCWMSCAKLP